MRVVLSETEVGFGVIHRDAVEGICKRKLQNKPQRFFIGDIYRDGGGFCKRKLQNKPPTAQRVICKKIDPLQRL